MQHNDLLISFTKNNRINILIHLIVLMLFVLFLSQRAIENALTRQEEFFLRVKNTADLQCQKVGGDSVVIKNKHYICANTKSNKVIDTFIFKDGNLHY